VPIHSIVHHLISRFAILEVKLDYSLYPTSEIKNHYLNKFDWLTLTEKSIGASASTCGHICSDKGFPISRTLAWIGFAVHNFDHNLSAVSGAKT
jgi:hypothetical protein